MPKIYANLPCARRRKHAAFQPKNRPKIVCQNLLNVRNCDPSRSGIQGLFRTLSRRRSGRRGRKGRRKKFLLQVHPSGAIVAQNGILCANDFPLKVSIEEGLARRGVPPKGHWSGNGLNRRKPFKETNSRTRRRKEDTTRRTTEGPKDEPSAKTTKDCLPTTTKPNHAFIPKSRWRLSQNAKFDTGKQGVK